MNMSNSTARKAQAERTQPTPPTLAEAVEGVLREHEHFAPTGPLGVPRCRCGWAASAYRSDRKMADQFAHHLAETLTALLAQHPAERPLPEGLAAKLRSLHRRITLDGTHHEGAAPDRCGTCRNDQNDPDDMDHMFAKWPCPTIALLDASDTGAGS